MILDLKDDDYLVITHISTSNQTEIELTDREGHTKISYLEAGEQVAYQVKTS